MQEEAPPQEVQAQTRTLAEQRAAQQVGAPPCPPVPDLLAAWGVGPVAPPPVRRQARSRPYVSPPFGAAQPSLAGSEANARGQPTAVLPSRQSSVTSSHSPMAFGAGPAAASTAPDVKPSGRHIQQQQAESATASVAGPPLPFVPSLLTLPSGEPQTTAASKQAAQARWRKGQAGAMLAAGFGRQAGLAGWDESGDWSGVIPANRGRKRKARTTTLQHDRLALVRNEFLAAAPRLLCNELGLERLDVPPDHWIVRGMQAHPNGEAALKSGAHLMCFRLTAAHSVACAAFSVRTRQALGEDMPAP
jgi:hypothetical protein